MPVLTNDLVLSVIIRLRVYTMLEHSFFLEIHHLQKQKTNTGHEQLRCRI